MCSGFLTSRIPAAGTVTILKWPSRTHHALINVLIILISLSTKFPRISHQFYFLKYIGQREADAIWVARSPPSVYASYHFWQRSANWSEGDRLHPLGPFQRLCQSDHTRVVGARCSGIMTLM